MTKDPYSGRLLANRYQLIELVGTGAMGQVYRAEDTLLGGVIVAVKFLSQTLLNKKMRERFEREATISALLGEKSIHIVKVRDYGIDENEIPFYVMEFLQGDGLSEIIKNTPLSLPRFLTVTRQICLGMECAHNGIIFKGELCPIVHRDIKPSNIFVVKDSTLGELVKLLDFGIAKLSQSSDSQTHSFMGTLAYCSPEQMEGKELDNRSDIYSLGVMMYEMITNEMPILPETSSFGGWYKAHHEFPPQPFESNLNLPADLEKLIMGCLAKSPKDRPQNIGKILQVLESLEKNLISKHQKKVAPKRKFNYSNQTLNITSVEEICLQASWPEDKPQKKIVFPRLIHAPDRMIASLWVMLEYEDILKRMRSTRYNQFLFLGSPHPMVLWITVLYNRADVSRWLPCYLDLKTDHGLRVARILAESGTYRILFFALHEPDQCKHVMVSTIAPKQCKILKDWIKISEVDKHPSTPQASKKRLKQEFENLKPKILFKLEQAHTSTSIDISG
ncbi:MAG: serine/threonine protein kinase [Gomphosphaeria aponina SAG 52.96 = DSM 107014]|uniref:Serine/threonine protein kinase n=1 Tax=Gomphosphaeria aponina SAG 52.96 = DSM 107014 TaxID=1521640 RepID=A0A941JVD5_9CHRO|nr:serine/threonine protein kinase [Gomphosphaeria aponina SAG 52.96 = DSM 107014]